MPKLSLARKLTLAFLLVAVTAALLVAVFIRLTNADQFNQLVMAQQRTAFETSLVSYYQTNGSWAGVLPYMLSNRSGGGPQATAQPDYGNGDGYGRGYGGNRGPGPGGRHGLIFGPGDGQGNVDTPLAHYPFGSHADAPRPAQSH